jgi:hypothetical protein
MLRLIRAFSEILSRVEYEQAMLVVVVLRNPPRR